MVVGLEGGRADPLHAAGGEVEVGTQDGAERVWVFSMAASGCREAELPLFSFSFSLVGGAFRN